MSTEHTHCPICNKLAFEVSRLDTSDSVLVKLRCGHVIKNKKIPFIKVETKTEAQPEMEDDSEFNSEYTVAKNGDKLFPFQVETKQFIYNSGGKCLIAHEQGLGKTVIALAALAEQPQMLPALVVCKGNLGIQWMKQVMNWLPGDIFPQVIESSKDFILPNFQVYIISYDLLRRMSDKFHDYMNDHIKTVILDEIQHIKNTASKRANFVRDVCRDKQHIIALSGTPIKNHAGEYFTILNLLHPERFPGKDHFYYNYIDTYFDGRSNKVGGLKNPAFFHEQTKDFIIRYEQAEVLPDLPELTRDFQYYDIDKDLREQYDETAKEMADFLEDEGENAFSFANYSMILAYLTKMRQITAVAKVEAVADYIGEYLESTEEKNGKIIVFLHHHIARDILIKVLEKRLDPYSILVIKENHNNDQRENIKSSFKSKHDISRVLILGTLSSGEGLDGLQDSCDTMIMMERQWNPANEEQAEKRLHRIGQNNPVKVVYPIAVGTCDELFTDTVERKRQICKETYGDSEVVAWQETDIIKSLCVAIVEKRGGKKWQLI